MGLICRFLATIRSRGAAEGGVAYRGGIFGRKPRAGPTSLIDGAKAARVVPGVVRLWPITRPPLRHVERGCTRSGRGHLHGPGQDGLHCNDKSPGREVDQRPYRKTYPVCEVTWPPYGPPAAAGGRGFPRKHE